MSHLRFFRASKSHKIEQRSIPKTSRATVRRAMTQRATRPFHTCDKVASVTGRVARCIMARRTVARLVFGIERCSILLRQRRATKSQV